ncbi:unnamed protein product [Meganyctiphanes norvegica]|uniref:C2H2-type domain-containing protein n=1 Tax=Meganyctiphanes norvegica TaxID=48144 RepID=A0AAV2REY2_MEGNR
METSQAPQDLVCSICWPCKTFKLKHHLRNHQRTVHSLQVVVPGHYKCLEDSCHQTFRYVEQLREHLNHSHAQFQGKFYVQELRFASFDDFEEWKKQEEERSIVRYIKSNSGSKITRSGMQHKYYVCSRSGKVRLTGKGIRKLKRQGSSKLNTRCTASIKADIHPSGLVTVKYCREHYGHEQGIKNIGHVGLSQNDRNWLANQILEGVPLDTILLKIQEGRGRPNSERLLMTTKTDLRNIRRQYGFHLPINKLFTCLEPGCNLTMENIRGAREKLRNHLEQQHNCIFDIHKETFSSDEEFEVWKSRLEAEAGIIFVRGSIRNFKSGRTRTYYRCSMSGIQKTKGNNHTVCTAEMIVVREMSGAQSVTYCLDHYGHQLNNTEVLTAVQNISDNQHSLILDTINSQTATVTIGRRLFLPDQESLSKFSPDGTDEIVNSIFISEVDDAMRPQYKRMEPNYESVIKIKKVVTKPIENSIHRNLDNFEFMGKSKNFQLNSEGIRVAREEVVASVDSFL